MTRSIPGRDERQLAEIRLDLAGVAVEVELIRMERLLARKYRADQPRAPAGQPDGGRWVGDESGYADPDVTGSIGGGSQGGSQNVDSHTEETVTGDGSRVLSIRIRANRRTEWDEQHTVTAPDGTSTVFETSGLTQTIRDGDTGEILGKSTLTADGAVPEAFVQPARGLPPAAARLAKQAGERLVQAALTLWAALTGRDGDDRKAVFVGPASEYVPGEGADGRALWVGAINQTELDQICPRNGEVRALANSAARGCEHRAITRMRGTSETRSMR